MLDLNLCSGYFRLAQQALPVDFVVSSYFNVFVKIFWEVYIWNEEELTTLDLLATNCWEAGVGWCLRGRILTCVVWNHGESVT